jgi:hemolysin-activating ACP:hemolysin acyltransferase
VIALLQQSPHYRDVTVGSLLTRLADAFPGNEAFVYSDRGLRLTYAELES